MIDQETLRKLREMKLSGLATGFEELLRHAPPHDMTALEVVGSLVDREWQDRESRRMGRLLKAARLGQDACLEDVRCSPAAVSTRPSSAISAPAAGSASDST